MFVFGILVIGCKSSQLERPKNVPARATPIAIPHGYDWDICSVDKIRNVNRCQIYNGSGVLMYDDIFVKYEGDGVVPEELLNISQKGGEQWIQLQDGTILIPKSHFEQVSRLIDWLKGRRKAP
jgi:hypothetical protein